MRCEQRHSQIPTNTFIFLLSSPFFPSPFFLCSGLCPLSYTTSSHSPSLLWHLFPPFVLICSFLPSLSCSFLHHSLSTFLPLSQPTLSFFSLHSHPPSFTFNFLLHCHPSQHISLPLSPSLLPSVFVLPVVCTRTLCAATVTWPGCLRGCGSGRL